ncbi:apoptosis regulator BAX-like [Brevipalpus obovatus]|uniref:apoptosis regulator BAX-like n=1 Tax=Brevipalpus obovatus TaxID=246614 RepID=UPI003D9E5BBF
MSSDTPSHVLRTMDDVEMIVYNYFKAQLHQKDLRWIPRKYNDTWNDIVDERLKRVVSTLNELSDELRSNGASFREMKSKTELVISALERQNGSIQDQSGYNAFACIAEHLFGEGIRWNHVLTLFVFTTELAHDFYLTRDDITTIDTVADWLVNYVTSRLSNWIRSNRGWDGLIDYYNQSNIASPCSTRSLWHTAVVIGGILAFSFYHFAYKH